MSVWLVLEANKLDYSGALNSVVQPVQAFSIPNFEMGRTSPEVIRLPRNRLNQQFAVLLMRSVYDAVDALDFVSMVSKLAVSAAVWNLLSMIRVPQP